MPAGRARATKATGGPSGHSSSLWPINTYFAGRALVWRAGPRQDTIKRTTAAPRPILWPWACKVSWLQLSCRPSQSDQGNWWSKWSQQFTLENFTLTSPIEHWYDAPAHDKIWWNGQRQYLDQSSGHEHAKFGGSSLPAGRARATNATGGPSGHSSSLWPIHTYFAGRALVWRADPGQDTIKKTRPAPRSIVWQWACQVWWLQLAHRLRQSDKGNWLSK